MSPDAAPPPANRGRAEKSAGGLDEGHSSARQLALVAWRRATVRLWVAAERRAEQRLRRAYDALVAAETES